MLTLPDKLLTLFEVGSSVTAAIRARSSLPGNRREEVDALEEQHSLNRTQHSIASGIIDATKRRTCCEGSSIRPRIDSRADSPPLR